ncbi:MAG: PhoH family protein [Desulfovibrio sp.]|uniref:PhoH family protein n=1 Tax=Desulfovibrio sp. TaxID=885 RepID=UPI0025907675|nr:PhoH family protein [Desulfovibrio sp.]MCD7985347.1 PhoH family protein [Desulfovibrio sp.]
MAVHSSLLETVEFDDPALANQLFGPHNAHLDLLAAASGARIGNRGASIFIESPDQDVRQSLCNVFVQLYDLLRGGLTLSQQDMTRAYDMLRADPGLNLGQVFRDAVFVNTPRKTVTARNVAQKTYLELLRRHELVFAVGPAGTGKTYLAVAMALSMFQQHRVKRIVLTRPAVEAGERLGFLPGDLAEKVNPYLRPLYDALHDMMPQPKVASMLEVGSIEVAPLAFMRGRTLNDAFIILDEAQNTTQEQMKMFLTRMGFGSRMVVTGDITQIDLPMQPGGARPRSGLIHALGILHNVSGLAVHRFSKADVVRHPLVGAIVSAYDHAEKDGASG